MLPSTVKGRKRRRMAKLVPAPVQTPARRRGNKKGRTRARARVERDLRMVRMAESHTGSRRLPKPA